MLDVRLSADYVRFSPKSGRIDIVTVESAPDPKRTFSRMCGSVGEYQKPVISLRLTRTALLPGKKPGACWEIYSLLGYPHKSQPAGIGL